MTFDATVLALSPTAYYNTTETSGTTFADSAGTADGTLTGSNATLGATIHGESAVEFTASDSFVTCPIGSVSVAGSFACTFRIYSDSGSSAALGYATSQSPADTGARTLGMLFGTGAFDAEGVGPSGGATLVADTDYFLVGTQAAGGAQNLYINGSLDVSGSYTPGTASGGDLFFPMGAFGTGVSHVAIGKVAFWDGVELSSGDVSAMFAALGTSGGGGGTPVATRRSWDGGFTVDFDTAGGDFDPAVDAGPAFTAPAFAQIAATTVDSVSTSGGRQVPEVRALAVPRLRYRITVGGKDVTNFRGVRTPPLTYGLISPLLYGSGSLTLPQIHAALERFGEGDLAFLKKFATVKQQRIDDEGNIVATDYIGFISDDPADGRSNTFTLGGQATGRAAMQDRPVPVVQRRLDAGQIVMGTIRNRLRLPTANEPATGITISGTGGMSQLDFLTETLATSTLRDGTQWTVMPNTEGKYRMFQKDLETIDATVYIDGFRVAESLRRDFTEEPNRVWAQGIAPDGKRLRFAILPGLATGDRPAFPGTLSPGDSGDGVSTLMWRLYVTGLLDDVPTGEVWTTDSDDPVTRAVKDLQDAAGLSETGSVNAATWKALFDPDASGYSLKGATVLPAAQRSYTEPWLRNASGQRVGHNPNYVRSAPWVDATVDMGAGFTRAQIHKWARNELAPADVSNWVGTVTVATGAVIDGEHNPGDPLTTDLVRDARSVKPGMNLWLANWDGGTLVHVSGVQVQQGSVEFAVDTRARDTMKVWEVIHRNRESRKNPARQWIAQNRRSGLRDDTGAFYDGGVFGKIPRTPCEAGTWTVIPTPAGRSGTLQNITLEFEDPVEFAVQIWARHKTTDWLDSHVGNWSTTSFWNHLNENVNQWKDQGLIDHWGNVDQPAGYGHAAKTGPDGVVTAAVVSGKFNFDAGAPYYCFGEPVLWIAVRPLMSTHIKGGRVLELLLDDAAG